MDSSLCGLRCGFGSRGAGFEDARRFFGGPVVSVRFRFFWEEGIVKKEDIVVVWREIRPGEDFEIFEDEFKNYFSAAEFPTGV
jgi:hypothetical protein